MYGSHDGYHVNTDMEFHNELMAASEKLHIKPHKVIQGGINTPIASHVDVKGIRGSFGFVK